MLTTLDIESLVAVTGCLNPTVSDGDIQKASELPSKLRAKVRTFIERQQVKPFEEPKQRDFKRTAEKIGSTVLSSAPMLDAIDFASYDLKVNQCRKALVARLPSQGGRNPVDDLQYPLSMDEENDWFSLVDMFESSTSLTDEVSWTTLTPEQVSIYKENLPLLYTEVCNEANTAMTDMAAKGEELYDEVETTLQILLGHPHIPPIAIQPMPEPIKPSRKVDLKASSLNPSKQD